MAVSLHINHYWDYPDYIAAINHNPMITSLSHLVSYRDGDNIVITKSRWFTGKYPHKKDGKNFIVSIETYAQIAQDTINIFLKGSSTTCLL